MKAIVYESKTGFTKRYAEMLAKDTGLDIYERKEANKLLQKNEDIIYLGWIGAGSISGYTKASKRYSVKILCGVGMASPSEKVVADLEKRYNSKDMKIFYLQGGFDINKLTGFYKVMMNAMAKTVSKALGKKENKTEEEEIMLEMFKNGGDYVKEENLAPILQLLK